MPVNVVAQVQNLVAREVQALEDLSYQIAYDTAPVDTGLFPVEHR